MINHNEVKRRLFQSAKVRDAYDSLLPEFARARKRICRRINHKKKCFSVLLKK